jgi:hypothetical protein
MNWVLTERLVAYIGQAPQRVTRGNENLLVWSLGGQVARGLDL